jgi:hypothetical protein
MVSAEDDDLSGLDALFGPTDHLPEGEPVTGVIDPSMPILREVLDVLDRHLADVYVQAEQSRDPITFGVVDRIDWIVGFGFTACQTYITEIGATHTRGWHPADLRKRGPVHTCGHHIATLVHEVANHWKHRYEEKVSKNREIALSSLLGGFSRWDGYDCYFALETLLAPNPPRFEHLVPLLEEWRDALPDDPPPMAPATPS